MFLPLIIAILLGLVNPANHTSNCNSGGTVYVNTSDPNSGDPNDPGNGEGGGDDGGNTGGTGEVGGDGPGSGGPTTGENGHLPPPKP